MISGTLKDRFLTAAIFCIFALLNCGYVWAVEKVALIHLHSDFSTGSDTIAGVSEKARQSGAEVMFMTDHDVIGVEYGIPPFRNIFKKGYELQSVTERGASAYLRECGKLSDEDNGITVIPGTESTAHYFWTGSFFNGNLTANNWQKHILILGYHNADEIDNLPVIHNGFSSRYFTAFLPRALIFAAALFFSFLLYGRGGRVIKIFSATTAVLSLLFIINYNPFKSARFSQYDTNAGTAPYQELIDYANENNLVTIWAHPESYREKEIEGVKMITPGYADDLLNTDGYTAFEGLYRDTSEMINPGRQWDILLNEFLDGMRSAPVWTVGGIDYHGDEGEDIGEVETALLIDSSTRENALDALRRGRCYARRKSASADIVIEAFSLKDGTSDNRARSGENISIEGEAQLKIKLAEKSGKKIDCRLKIVKSGDLFTEKDISLPCEEIFPFAIKDGEKGYFRIMVESDDGGRALSNPVFFNAPLN